MWGKRQRADDWDEEQGNSPSGDRRDQRSDDRRGGAYWDEPSDWAANNGNRQNFGDQGFADNGRRGFGEDDRQGFGGPSWAQQQRRGRGDYPDSSPFGSEGGQPADPAFGEPGFGGARPDAWQGDPRRPMRNFPEAGNSQPGFGGRGGDFGSPDLDRRDLDRRDGGGQWNDAGGWGQADPEVSVPVFTPAGQVPSPVSGAVAANGFGNRPYGRLSIFTLHDDRAAEFDRLAEQAAEGVSTHEPDTLVYVMHVVPKAPMQRIIYEIYRDHAAFENHQRQPHILEFEEGRRSCVLVTNIIDLRLKYAKVAPLQGAAQQPAGRPQLPASPSQPGPGARHRAQQPAEPDGGWFGESPDGRPADLEDGDWAADRSFGGGDRRSQDWGQPQYTGQRYRDN